MRIVPVPPNPDTAPILSFPPTRASPTAFTSAYPVSLYARSVKVTTRLSGYPATEVMDTAVAELSSTSEVMERYGAYPPPTGDMLIYSLFPAEGAVLLESL